MKKTAVSLLLVFTLLFSICAIAFADNEEWKERPVITRINEISKEKLSMEWEGKADLYQVYVDGKIVTTVKLNTAIIELKAGSHQIIVKPIRYVSKNADTNFELNFGVGDLASAGGSIDLGALGIDPKDLVQGTPSNTFMLNYTVNPLFEAVPQILSACTDFNDRVLLTFSDKYDSDRYSISIKSGKDINYIEFDKSSPEAEELITKSNSQVTITLDPDYLKNKRCLIPELDQKYSFLVKLLRNPENYVDGTEEVSIYNESRESKEFDYTPYAAWKNSPEITYASQTADGQITLKWEHNDNGLGCEYTVYQLDKVLGVTKGKIEIGNTTEKEYLINDLVNGKYSYTVVPEYGKEQGLASDDTQIEVTNSWMSAPALECTNDNCSSVLLKWVSPAGVESYHITVSAGSNSLLKYVNLDYNKYEEFDVPSEPGEMEYLFEYKDNIDQETGVKLKFDIYGVRHASDGTEQKSATSSNSITIK